MMTRSPFPPPRRGMPSPATTFDVAGVMATTLKLTASNVERSHVEMREGLNHNGAA